MKNKPIIEMEELETERMWADMNKPLYETMLNNARSPERAKCVLSLIVLNTVDGDKRIVSWAAEYGDDDGVGNDVEMVLRIRRLGMLRPGESVEHFTTEIDLTATRWVPVQ